MSSSLKVDIDVSVSVRATESRFVAKVAVHPSRYYVAADTTLPFSLIAMEPVLAESRSAHMAISHALAELSAKIASGR